MKQIALVFLFGAILSGHLLAQSNLPFFQPMGAEEALAMRSQPASVSELPAHHSTWHLDFSALQAALHAAPREFTQAAREHPLVVAFPNGSGVLEEFAVWETAMMEPELAARYPYIRTYAGRSVSQPGRTVCFSTTLRGFQAMIMRPDFGVEYVRPCVAGEPARCIAYDRANALPAIHPELTTGLMPGAAQVAALAEQPYAPVVESRGELLEPVKLKVYRFAVATTGEFGQDHGGTVPLALSAVVEYTNEVNAAFERDIDMRFQLVANNDKIIFVDPVTDPFSGTEAGEWLTQNPSVLNTVITPGKYDLGHVYARYLGGSAAGVAGAIGNACVSPNKAEGCSTGNLVGNTGHYEERFLVVIGQEVGHQMGGGHTWNRCGGGGGRQGNTAFEPGSGSTIMSYAGSCGSDNVQSYSDLYYHAGSIEEIKNYYLYANGNLCGGFLQTDNNAPVVTLPYTDNFYIPISTYFELNGSATDSDGDKMTYCWEELDAGPEVPLGEPSGNAAIFRTFPADTATYRYFPRLLNIINNTSSITEQLPTYSRDLTFRLTARDNRSNGGGVGWADVEFKSTDKAGPFKVLAPNNTTTTWRVGEYVNVQWDVANTEKSPVNCALVNIRLSTDAGKTYPIMLAEKVPNDGSHYIKVPATLSLTARVRIDAVDNVFFDISNSNFRILNPTTPSFSMGLSSDRATICQPDIFTSEILTAGVLGYATPVVLSVDRGSLPASAVVSLGTTQLTPGDVVPLSVDLNPVGQAGSYSFQIKAVALGSTDTLVRSIALTYYTNDFSALGLKAPADGSQSQALGQVLRWSLADDALAYDVQIATSVYFTAGTIVASKSDITVDSFKVPILLNKSTAYYWRVRPKNVCGTFPWTDPAFFSTFVESCSVFGANDLPKLISGSGTPTVESKITVNAGGAIKSINVKQIKGSHTFFKDLDARLISPQGTEVILFKNRCGGLSISFDFQLDDNALAPFTCPPGNLGLLYRPESPLSLLKNQTSTGTWILRVKDTQSSSGGNLEDFKLEFCAEVTLNPPFLVNNNPLSLISGTNAVIAADLLRVDDPNNSHTQLIYTLLSVPNHGELQLNGSPLQLGASFAQADIDGGSLRFYDWGNSTAEDGFRFVVTDNEGGFVATPKFRIQPTTVGIFEPRLAALDFGLAPNPASQSVWLTLSAPTEADARVRLLNATGQVLQSATLSRGTERMQLLLTGLPQGLYWVQVESEETTGVKKLVVH